MFEDGDALNPKIGRAAELVKTGLENIVHQRAFVMRSCCDTNVSYRLVKPTVCCWC